MAVSARALVPFVVLYALCAQALSTKSRHNAIVYSRKFSPNQSLDSGDVRNTQARAVRLTDVSLDFRHNCAGLHQPLERLHVHAIRQSLTSGIKILPDRLLLAHGTGEFLNVSWSGVPEPKYDDWIALVVPADANLTETAPAKWKFAAGDPHHIATGSGSLRSVPPRFLIQFLVR